MLNKLVNMPERTIKYLSPAIRNELLGILSKSVKDEMVNEMKSAPFFSIMMDTTQDLDKTDQLSQIFVMFLFKVTKLENQLN